MSTLCCLLELVQLSNSTDNGLHTKLVGETLGLLRRADVEGKVDLLEESGRREDLAEERGTDVAWEGERSER